MSSQDTPTQQSQPLCIDGTQAKESPCFNPTHSPTHTNQNKKKNPNKPSTTKKIPVNQQACDPKCNTLLPIYRQQNTDLRTRSSFNYIPLPCFPLRFKEEKTQPSKLFSSFPLPVSMSQNILSRSLRRDFEELIYTNSK